MVALSQEKVSEQRLAELETQLNNLQAETLKMANAMLDMLGELEAVVGRLERLEAAARNPRN